MSDVYGASDYAGMSGGKWSFYYGYEFIWCPALGFVDRCNDDGDDGHEHEWAFTASYDKQVVAQYKASDIGAGMDIDTEMNVLRGIARMLDEIEIAPPASVRRGEQ